MRSSKLIHEAILSGKNKWLCQNELPQNGSKFNTPKFGKINCLLNIKKIISLNKEIFEKVQISKYLRVNIDSKFVFYDHIQ